MNVKHKVSQKQTLIKLWGRINSGVGGGALSSLPFTMLCSATKTVLEHSELTLAVSVRMAEIFLDFDDVIGNKNLALSD